MKFKHVECIVGVVVDSDDPKCLGRIRAVVPSQFDTASMNKSSLPWMYPFMMFGLQTFSKLAEGARVWMIRDKDVENGFWYVPYYQTFDDVQQYIKNNYDANPEVLFARPSAKGCSMLTYDDTNGLVYHHHGHKIPISDKSDEELINTSDKSQIKDVKVQNDQVCLGSHDNPSIDPVNNQGETSTSDEAPKQLEPLVKGNQLITLLNNLVTNLNYVSQKCTTENSLRGLIQAFKDCADKLEEDSKNLLSEDVFTT